MRQHDNVLRINTASSGDTELVPAVADKATKVYGLRLSVAGAVIVSIKRGSTVLEVFNFAAAGTMAPLVLRDSPYYQTGTNEAFNINLSGAVQCNGVLEYSVS
jgi:hypothetical protein